MPDKKKSSARSEGRTPPKRQRLAPAVRKTHILESAARMVVQQGYLPLPIEQLAKSVGVSKALIYTYFPDQHTLFNHLLERELTGLLTGGLDIASQMQDIEQSAVLSAMLYFEHVARLGPLLSIVLSDRYMAGHIERRLLRIRHRILHRLAALAARQLKLSRREATAAIEMLTAIPEELGRLVFAGQLDSLVAQQVCRQMMLSSIQSLRDPDRALAIAAGG